jgi:hypothetical protein
MHKGRRDMWVPSGLDERGEGGGDVHTKEGAGGQGYVEGGGCWACCLAD